jgi:hypothetical protein
MNGIDEALDGSGTTSAPRLTAVPTRNATTTEYERLAAAFDSVCQRQDAFVESGMIFADTLTDGFGEYLKCPRTAIAFQPEDVDIREVGLKRYALEQAVKVRKDGWFGFRITVQLRSSRHISFPLTFKRTSDASWVVKLLRTTEQFEISESLDGADAAFRSWVDLATTGFESMLEGLLRQGDSSTGFEFEFKSRRE